MTEPHSLPAGALEAETVELLGGGRPPSGLAFIAGESLQRPGERVHILISAVQPDDDRDLGPDPAAGPAPAVHGVDALITVICREGGCAALDGLPIEVQADRNDHMTTALNRRGQAIVRGLSPGATCELRAANHQRKIVDLAPQPVLAAADREPPDVLKISANPELELVRWVVQGRQGIDLEGDASWVGQVVVIWREDATVFAVPLGEAENGRAASELEVDLTAGVSTASLPMSAAQLADGIAGSGGALYIDAIANGRKLAVESGSVRTRNAWDRLLAALPPQVDEQTAPDSA